MLEAALNHSKLYHQSYFQICEQPFRLLAEVTIWKAVSNRVQSGLIHSVHLQHTVALPKILNKYYT